MGLRLHLEKVSDCTFKFSRHSRELPNVRHHTMIEHRPVSRPGQPSIDAFRYYNPNMPWAFEAIGRLVSTYASLEQSLSRLFQEVSGSPWVLAAVMQGDGRPSTTMGTIKRLAKIQKWDEKVVSHMEIVFAEINYVKQMRDICAHCNPVYIADDVPWILFQNVFLAGPDKWRGTIVSGQDLYDYSGYVFELSRHLSALCSKRVPEPQALQHRPQLLETLYPRSRRTRRE